MSGEVGSDSTPATYRQTIVSLKRTISRTFGWSLNEIDETDISNLLAFVNFTPEADPNTRVIDGKSYTRADKPPSWL
jgi:hypothetical protein